MKKVELLKPHNGRPKGAVVRVDDLRAARMQELNIARDAWLKPAPSKRKPDKET